MIDPAATIRWDSDTALTQQFFRIRRFFLSPTFIRYLSDYSNPPPCESFLQLLAVRSKRATKTNGTDEESMGRTMGVEEPSQ
jgi:hypothetical protein